MRLPIEPLPFLGRLVGGLLAIYVVWTWLPFAEWYATVLVEATRPVLALIESSSDPAWDRGTTLIRKGTNIFYTHRHFAAVGMDPVGIPGEWVMANLVLLIALMLATPAPSWGRKAFRLGVALGVALVLQISGIVVATRATYAQVFTAYWSPTARQIYGFLDTFFQSFDTQLFPFAIWAGIHFRQLVGGARGMRASAPAPSTASEAAAPRPGRKTKGKKKRRR